MKPLSEDQKRILIHTARAKDGFWPNASDCRAYGGLSRRGFTYFSAGDGKLHLTDAGRRVIAELKLEV